MSESVADDVERVGHDQRDGRQECQHRDGGTDSCRPSVLDALVPHDVPGELVPQAARDGQGQVAEGKEHPDGRESADCVDADQPHKRDRFGQLVEDLLGLGVLHGIDGHLAQPFPIYHAMVNVSILNSLDG